MSRSCELLGVKPQTGHHVPVNRSQTGVRANRRFDPNIQKVSLASEVLGTIRLRIAVKTLRTVEHNGGIDKFLLKTSNLKLAPEGLKLKRKLIKALPEGAAKRPASTKKSKPGPKAVKAAAKRKELGIQSPKEKKAASKKPAAKKAAPKTTKKDQLV